MKKFGAFKWRLKLFYVVDEKGFLDARPFKEMYR